MVASIFSYKILVARKKNKSSFRCLKNNHIFINRTVRNNRHVSTVNVSAILAFVLEELKIIQIKKLTILVTLVMMKLLQILCLTCLLDFCKPITEGGASEKQTRMIKFYLIKAHKGAT